MSENVRQLKALKEKAEQALVSDTPARAFMSKSVFSVPEGTKIYNAIKMLSTQKISGAPVVNGARKLVGILSEYDLLIQAATKDLAQPVEYNKKVITVFAETTLKEILILLYNNKVHFRRVPVINSSNEVVGIVSRIDVLNQLLKGRK